MQIEKLNASFMMYDSAPRHKFSAKKQRQQVLRDVQLSVHVGEVVALVGASGSGKSLLCSSIFGLCESNMDVSGIIYFDGHRQDAKGLAGLRGRGISLIPQNAQFLDPLQKVGKQVLGNHNNSSKNRKKIADIFERYKLDSEVLNMYPHELSGGMLRRVLLACALMDEPKLIVADEPTPGLDLALARLACSDFRNFANDGGGVLFITHDLELAIAIADRIAIFLDGSVVEETSVQDFMAKDRLVHPFSMCLRDALMEDWLVE